MRYFSTALIFTIVIAAWVLVANTRSDELAQDIIEVCDGRFEGSARDKQRNATDNSNSIETYEECMAYARQAGERDRKGSYTTIAIVSGVVLVLYVAKKKLLTQ